MKHLKKILLFIISNVMLFSIVGCNDLIYDDDKPTLISFFNSSNEAFRVSFKFINDYDVMVKVTAEEIPLNANGDVVSIGTSKKSLGAGIGFKTMDNKNHEHQSFQNKYVFDDINNDDFWDKGDSLYILYINRYKGAEVPFSDMSYIECSVSAFPLADTESFIFRFNDSKEKSNSKFKQNYYTITDKAKESLTVSMDSDDKDKFYKLNSVILSEAKKLFE